MTKISALKYGGSSILVLGLTYHIIWTASTTPIGGESMYITVILTCMLVSALLFFIAFLKSSGIILGSIIKTVAIIVSAVAIGYMGTFIIGLSAL